MRIHSICVVKNENDIIVETLTAAAAWSDFIYVYDNGSTDGTWAKVLDLAGRVPQVVAFASEDRPFREDLRREPFNRRRDQSAPGDWWCKLDADEIYIDSPREFLAGVPARFDVVWAAMFQYYFTDKDAAQFARAPDLYSDEVPLEQKCKYYVNNWSAIRFFRDKPDLRWESGARPYPLTRAYPRRIRLKHYQYRSPRQIEMRLATRREAMSRGGFKHERRGRWAQGIVARPARGRHDDTRAPESWTERIVDSSRLTFDTGSDYVIAEAALPRISAPNAPLLCRATAGISRAARAAWLGVRGPRREGA